MPNTTTTPETNGCSSVAAYTPTPMQLLADAAQLLRDMEYHREGLLNTQRHLDRLDRALIAQGVADLYAKLASG